MDEMNVLMKGALLHDVGKICLRADKSLGNHSQAGVEFLKKFLGNSEQDWQILRCLKYHHSSNIKNAALADNDFSYIVYEADNIAAGMDRREIDAERKGFSAAAPLESVFNIFGGSDLEHQNNKYLMRGLDPEGDFNYPVSGGCNSSADKYSEFVEVLQSNFQRASVSQMEENELLRIMEDVASYIPSSTNMDEVCDISLFINSKVTAAIAACMKQYFDANKINNYRQLCYKDNKKFRDCRAFMLVSGDISGIQDFIYTIPSRGALKALRGRSVYLEILLENFIDELLENLGLSRANLLYSGGGHFYLLASATEAARSVIDSVKNSCNRWLLKVFGTKLYLALGTAECTANELIASSGQRSIFAQVSECIAKDKLNRYDAETLKHIFDADSIYNRMEEQGRECAVCHASSVELLPDDDRTVMICPMCRNLNSFGAKVLEEKSVFVISDKQEGAALGLFGFRHDLWLHVLKNTEIERFDGNITRIYSKNTALTGKFVSTRLWLADYCARNSKNKVLSFSELADASCGGKQGIKRLGVLRADVDNLGAAFVSGFIDNAITDRCKYATFSRYADLSRDMILFFKLAVDKICRGNIGSASENCVLFNIFGIQKPVERRVSIVYSGGDDMFLVGAWDDLLETAVDIRRAFARFTGGKLSFSAGLALFNDTFPVSMMASMTGKLEDAAKNVENKNSIALFGFDTETTDTETGLQCRHVYKWDDFTEKVCMQKIKFLQQHLDLQGNEANKLPAGKTMLYRMLTLLEDFAEHDRINLARFAYTLARMQPKGDNAALKSLFEDFQQQMYLWVKNKQDRKELITAFTLLIYYLREDKEA